MRSSCAHKSLRTAILPRSSQSLFVAHVHHCMACSIAHQNENKHEAGQWICKAYITQKHAIGRGEALRMENRTEPQTPLEIVVMHKKMQLKVMKSRKLQSNTNGKNAL